MSETLNTLRFGLSARGIKMILQENVVDNSIAENNTSHHETNLDYYKKFQETSDLLRQAEEDKNRLQMELQFGL